MNDKKEIPVFIDAFAGCGGLSLGLLKAGWRGLFAIEKDAFAFDTLKSNLTGVAAKWAFNWPDWLLLKPWSIEELMEQHADARAFQALDDDALMILATHSLNAIWIS